MTTPQIWVIVLIVIILIIVLIILILNAVFVWSKISGLESKVDSIVTTFDKTATAVQAAADSTIKLEAKVNNILPLVQNNIIPAVTQALTDIDNLTVEVQNAICNSITVASGSSNLILSSLATELECLCTNGLLTPNNCPSTPSPTLSSNLNVGNNMNYSCNVGGKNFNSVGTYNDIY